MNFNLEATYTYTAVKDIHTKTSELQELFENHEQTNRKRDQEMESLNFRNEQLTKRIMILQRELQNAVHSKKSKKKISDDPPSSDTSLLNEELQKKILENGQLLNSIADKDLEIIGYRERIENLEENFSASRRELAMRGKSKDEEQKEYRIKIQELEELVWDLSLSSAQRKESCGSASGENQKKPKIGILNKPSAEKKPKKQPNKQQGIKEVDLEDLKTNDLVAKNQKRYVVFVGNIPYDANKQDLIELFRSCGEIKHVRIPTEKKTSRPRGFAYVEAANEETYQKCLSKHHTSLKGRRVNVLYTQGGKKKGDDQKKEIKEKNFKLDAMRKKGMLLGSKKESQRRSFRRKKQSLSKNAGDEES